ncbi:DUF3068 domain-containing protein [Nocardioides plantarum]|uniref:DUF3068 domain-containing protein n=1 Tax=Nocardioides plantarum TaxID=29299 RepID=A0ABV5KDN9_9ACTN|nr:DUF3068 domain-containing protein [Nocardioides plantarum]
MRKALGFVLFGLGAALLAIGLVAAIWAPGRVKQTPVDVDTTTRLEGTAAKLDAATGELSAPRPIKIYSLTQTDSKVSDDKVVAFVNTQCVVFSDQGDIPDCGPPTEQGADTDPRVVDIGIDRFTTDRVTAEGVPSKGYIDGAVDHVGLVNKFPFDSKKRDYPYWDGATGKAWPAKFVEAVDLKGLPTYHYQVVIKDQPAEVTEGTEGTYSQTVDIYVEPKTGAVVQQIQDQQRYLADGTQVLDLKAQFTDKQVQTSVDDADDNIASLTLITRTIPLIGIIAGLLLILAGAVLAVLARRREEVDVPGARRREPVPA